MLTDALKEFFYLDDRGIDRLYSQMVKRVEVSRSEAINKSASGKIGVTGKLKAIFGLGELGASAGTTRSLGTAITTESTLTAYHKMEAIVDAFSEKRFGMCFSSLGDAASYSLTHSRKVFFCGQHKFDAPQFFKDNGAAAVNDIGYLLLQCGQIPHYDESEDYFKHPHFKAEMTCNRKKMPRSSRGMSATGHDAIYFRGYRGIQIPLNVFCAVLPLPGFVQLKPYAIWV